MNPRNLFSLTSHQRQIYQIQPDDFPGYNWHEQSDEYERPPYLDKSALRFWYNTQNSDFSTHWHNAQEIIIPLENGYTVRVQETIYHLEPGDILLIPSGELHSLSAPQTGARFIFLFELNPFSPLEDFSYIYSFLKKPIYISASVCSGIYEKQISLIMALAAHYWGNSPAKQLHIYSCLLEFYACYADYSNHISTVSSLKAVPPQPVPSTQKLNLVLEYLKQHYPEKITLESAAEIAGLSKYYFSRVFKQHTGYTFIDYLNSIRIQGAETFLAETNMTVSSISAACGYSSITSFNRHFYRLNGCTPLKFRTNIQSSR